MAEEATIAASGGIELQGEAQEPDCKALFEAEKAYFRKWGKRAKAFLERRLPGR